MSQESQIIRHLRSGHSLTPLEALKLFGCFRLGARIYELRRRYNIKSDMVTIRGKRVARYRMVRHG